MSKNERKAIKHTKIAAISSLIIMILFSLLPIFFAEEITKGSVACSAFWGFLAGMHFEGSKWVFSYKRKGKKK